LVAKGFPHKLVIIGSDWLGYQDVLLQHVDILNLSERVTFTGAIPHEQLPEYLWDADLFVLMSTVESFGLPVVEAMAAGVPVIVSDTSSLPEIAGDAAITAPPQTPSRLAAEMMRILSDRTLARQMRERGINRARGFDWTETAARAMDLFNRVGARDSSHKEVA
jgi:glycosyltransferase involved in cell wall biosynthesis